MIYKMTDLLDCCVTLLYASMLFAILDFLQASSNCKAQRCIYQQTRTVADTRHFAAKAIHENYVIHIRPAFQLLQQRNFRLLAEGFDSNVQPSAARHILLYLIHAELFCTRNLSNWHHVATNNAFPVMRGGCSQPCKCNECKSLGTAKKKSTGNIIMA